MGFEQTYRPEYLRKRAEKFRDRAANCDDAKVAESLLRIARSYDELAGQAARVRAAKQPAE